MGGGNIALRKGQAGRKMAQPKHGLAKWCPGDVSSFATYWSGICTLQVWGLGKVISLNDEQSRELQGDTALPTNQVWPPGSVREGEKILSKPVEWPLLPLPLKKKKEKVFILYWSTAINNVVIVSGGQGRNSAILTHVSFLPTISS